MIDKNLINLALQELAKQPPLMFTDPCISCGDCCRALVCKIGQTVYGIEKSQGPCPGLVQKEDKYLCAFVLAEMVVVCKPEDRKLALSLGIGQGCGNARRKSGGKTVL